MLRTIARLTVGIAMLLAGLSARSATCYVDQPDHLQSKDPAPIYVFVDGPNGLEGIKERLGRPDFVILKGSLYDQLRRLERASAGVEPIRGVVESVAIEGEVFGDLAHLSADFGISMAAQAPAWVPIRLDGLVPREAREGDRILPLKSAEGGWRVELRGEGLHKVRVDLIAAVASVRGSLDFKKLECAIPEAASTRLQLVLGPRVDDAAILGGVPAREPVGVEPIEAGQRSRVSASLTPRRKLELTWRAATESATGVPPSVTAQGDIALEVERGSIRAWSSWDVKVVRGALHRLELRIDPDDELLGLEWDNKPVGGGEARDKTSGTMSFNLPDPLRANNAGKLVVTTRRALPAGASPRTTYRGVPLLGVTAQQGNLAIVQRNGDSWVSPTPGPGLHQVDPRELPTSLRNFGSIILGYKFAEQPFEFGVQVDPAPPWVRVESRTTVTIESSRARVETWLDYTVSQGRVFEVKVGVPEPLTLDAPAGPEAVVETWERRPNLADGGQAVVARLRRSASEEGKFSIHLSGSQPIAPVRAVSVAMFRPLEVQSRGGHVAVMANRGTAVEVAASKGEFSSAGPEPPANWAWPGSLPSAVPALWLRHDEPATSLPLAISARDRVVTEESTLDALVERGRIEMNQEFAIRVRFGSLARLDVAIPPEMEPSWEVDGDEVTRREAMGDGPDGWPRYRLVLARELTDALRLRFRGRIPLDPALPADASRRLSIPRIRVLDASSGPLRVRVGADESIDLTPEGSGWRADGEDLATRRNSRFAARWSRLELPSEAPVAAVVATARGRASLPGLVASRLAIRTTHDSDGALRSSALFRVESHGGTFAVQLPAGAEWVRARVGREETSEVNRLTETPGAYRLKLPADSSRPVVIGLEYIVPPSGAGATWGAPRLIDGGVVQQTLWEVRIPSQWAVAGTPEGWGDENRWRWRTYAFLREPNLSPEAMDSWVAGQEGRRDSPGEPDVTRGGLHAYLFSRVGAASEIRPMIAHRAWVLGIFSGASLGLGLAVIFGRPRRRTLVMTTMMVVVATAACLPYEWIVLVAQSSALGAALAMLAAMAQRLVDRRLPDAPIFAEPLLGGGSVPPLPGRSLPVNGNDVGSDASTIVKTRSGTTIDHAANARSPGGEGGGK